MLRCMSLPTITPTQHGTKRISDSETRNYTGCQSAYLPHGWLTEWMTTNTNMHKLHGSGCCKVRLEIWDFNNVIESQARFMVLLWKITWTAYQVTVQCNTLRIVLHSQNKVGFKEFSFVIVWNFFVTLDPLCAISMFWLYTSAVIIQTWVRDLSEYKAVYVNTPPWLLSQAGKPSLMLN